MIILGPGERALLTNKLRQMRKTRYVEGEFISPGKAGACTARRLAATTYRINIIVLLMDESGQASHCN